MTTAADSAVVDMIESAQQVIQSAQGILAAAAGELDRRSSGAGDASLSGRLGWKTARGLIAAKAGISLGEAARAVDVGKMIRPAKATSGEDLPAERPHIAAAVLGGDLPLSVAQRIDHTLEQVAWHLTRDDLDVLEHGLVTQFLSGRFSIAKFIQHCAETVEQFDPPGAKQRDRNRRAKASISETWLPDGSLQLIVVLDPERAAFYKTAVNLRTNPRRSRNNEQAKGETASARPATASTAKQPSRMEVKLEAFVSILRDAIKADDGRQAGVDTTILVRMDLLALISGIGAATIDGIATPISAAAARRLAAEADIIPQVLNGRSQVLDQGESKREFTKAQRYAILGAYSGCAFPDCDIPSSMVEFHHVGSWKKRHDHGKATDLENGLPLCGWHNRLMEDGWEIRFDENRVPWFIPPKALDWAQRPIRGGNLTGERAA